MIKISSYILTKNSEKYLSEILSKLEVVSDEILVVDSGSTDKTESITRRFKSTRFCYNEFLNFRDQRLIAEKLCTYNTILFVDSDEVPDFEFIKSIKQVKTDGLKHDAYMVSREWNVLGENVHCIYPISSPDYPIRLYNKKNTSFQNSQLVHENPSGFHTVGMLKGSLRHITFRTKIELKQKVEFYTNIAAQDLIFKRKKINVIKIIFSPIAAFIKWYFLKQGYKDGYIGLVLGKYAYDYSRKKYTKGKHLLKNCQSNRY